MEPSVLRRSERGLRSLSKTLDRSEADINLASRLDSLTPHRIQSCYQASATFAQSLTAIALSTKQRQDLFPLYTCAKYFNGPEKHAYKSKRKLEDICYSIIFLPNLEKVFGDIQAPSTSSHYKDGQEFYRRLVFRCRLYFDELLLLFNCPELFTASIMLHSMSVRNGDDFTALIARARYPTFVGIPVSARMILLRVQDGFAISPFRGNCIRAYFAHVLSRCVVYTSVVC